MSKQEVKLLAADLRVGEDSGFIPCPFCRAEHEEKFSITRSETGLLYNCFRASCGASGFIGTGYWEAEYGEKPARPKRRPYLGKVLPLEGQDIKFFRDTWGLRNTEGFGVTDRDEYILPLLAPDGYRKGYVVRQPQWKGRSTCPRKGVEGKPRALTYKDEPHFSKLSWSHQRSSKHVVIVEDIISAWKISQVGAARGVALNGAQMGYEDVKEVGAQRPGVVTVWLDPDATNAAYKIQSKWGLSFNFCHVVTSHSDPKDMTEEEIKEKLDVAFW